MWKLSGLFESISRESWDVHLIHLKWKKISNSGQPLWLYSSEDEKWIWQLFQFNSQIYNVLFRFTRGGWRLKIVNFNCFQEFDGPVFAANMRRDLRVSTTPLRYLLAIASPYQYWYALDIYFPFSHFLSPPTLFLSVYAYCVTQQ